MTECVNIRLFLNKNIHSIYGFRNKIDGIAHQDFLGGKLLSIKFPEETQSITELDTTNKIIIDVTSCTKNVVDNTQINYSNENCIVGTKQVKFQLGGINSLISTVTIENGRLKCIFSEEESDFEDTISTNIPCSDIYNSVVMVHTNNGWSEEISDSDGHNVDGIWFDFNSYNGTL